MEGDCKSEFNRLSGADRLKLKGAAVTKAITGFVREETEARPWLYPFCIAYLAVVVTPLPFFGASTLLIAATVAWAKMSNSKPAQRLNGKLKEAFNEAALVCDHKEYLAPDPEKPDHNRVKGLALAWHTTKRSAADTWAATTAAWRGLARLVP